MSADLERLAAAVEAELLARGGRQQGDEILCRCPTPEHADEHPSCRYSISKRVYICDPCGASGGLLVGARPLASLLDVEPAKYRDKGGRPPLQPPHRNSWEIRNSDGQLIATHCRHDLENGEKRMWWSRNGEKGLHGLKVTELPLYGAHLLTEREPGDDTPIFVTEGEKAADALLELGLPTLGTTTGSGQTPCLKSLEVLRHRDVVLWPDNDAPGRKHMQEIAKALEGVVASVRVFAPDLPSKGDDAVEWLREHGAGDPFEDLLAAVEEEAVDPETVDPAELTLSLNKAVDCSLTHDGLALQLEQLWPDARYVEKWGRWLFFGESHWATDESLVHVTRCREFLRSKAETLSKKNGATLRSAHTVAQVVGLARSNPVHAATVEQWDSDAWLLGTPKGTVDLRTGELREARFEDYITKATAVGPAPVGTSCPLWSAFLDRITDGNDLLQDYLRRFAGYSLTGSVEEHVFAFGHGSGANGKGVFTGTLIDIFDDYAITIPTEMLMVTRNERHPTELARLRGVRLAIGSETESSQRWAEARIKSLTGGDVMVGRFMRQDYFEFEPTFKLFLVGNHRPSLRSVDEAMRRRLHLVPFNVTIPKQERDLKLRDNLRSEWPAILRWAIDGCLEWQRKGLDPPERVQAATNEYLEAEDAFSIWVETCTVASSSTWESASRLFESWRQWAEGAGEWAGSQKRLAQLLSEHGYQQKRGPTGARGYMGLDLKPEEGEKP